MFHHFINIFGKIQSTIVNHGNTFVNCGNTFVNSRLFVHIFGAEKMCATACSTSIYSDIIMGCILLLFYALCMPTQSTQSTGPFIHTFGGEAANSRHQRPHFPLLHFNGGNHQQLEAMQGSVSCPRTL